jgi:secondary thiamine-phosphate synthase enzyme
MPRGFHLVTREVESRLPELQDFTVGTAQIHILHTSAGLTLNENADPTVRIDFRSWFDRAVAENEPYYQHTFEGPDDMPAHIKATLCGSTLNLPISKGRFRLGTWQGIYLCEFRNHGGSRRLVVTLTGDQGVYL